MRSPFRVVALVIAVSAAAALADSLVVVWANGPGIQTAQVAANAHVSFQCPGQAVYYRPGGCTGCAVDAGCAADGGFCDYIADFNASKDPVGPIVMANNMTKLHFAAVDGGVVACSVGRENP